MAIEISAYWSQLLWGAFREATDRKIWNRGNFCNLVVFPLRTGKGGLNGFRCFENKQARMKGTPGEILPEQ
ncbi:hypothetical protein AGIG_G14035 [Arapaima gigas]